MMSKVINALVFVACIAHARTSFDPRPVTSPLWNHHEDDQTHHGPWTSPSQFTPFATRVHQSFDKMNVPVFSRAAAIARFWLLPACFVLSDSFPSVIGVRVCLVTRFLPLRVCSVLSDPFQCGSFDQKTKMDVRKDEVKWWLICHWQERRETMQNWVN